MIDDTTLVVASVDLGLIALDVRSGMCLWRFDPDVELLDIANLGSTLVLHAATHTLFGISHDGQHQWTLDIPQKIQTWWPGRDGVLVLSEDGEGRWVDTAGQAGGRVHYGIQPDLSRPCVDEKNQALILSGRGEIHAFDIGSGQRRWTCPAALESDVSTGGVITQGVFIAAGREANVYGVDVESGTLRWNTVIHGINQVKGIPVTIDESVIVVTDSYSQVYPGDAILRLSVHDGSQAWRLKSTGGFTATPACTATSVIACENRHGLRAVAMDSGETLWKCETSGGLSTTRHMVAHPHGIVAVGTDIAQGFLSREDDR